MRVLRGMIQNTPTADHACVFAYASAQSTTATVVADVIPDVNLLAAHVP